ncbi:anti-CBASS protein Acb1 family protein [Roseovarius mucosus]|uniref:anti-CBASS protein Acb1 family protein n=1 Tax=Roseovarius mucosus TaxID=215743 RepID=UPI0035CEEFBF
MTKTQDKIQPINDGLLNLVSGMGTARDKGGQAHYASVAMSHMEILEAYEASSMIQRAIDMPAEDSCREWREWQAEAVDISAIETEEMRLGLKAKVFEARRLARLYGGAAVLIGTGDADPSKPLDPKRLTIGGLKYLTVLSRDEMSAREIERDPRQEGFGKPKFWSVNTAEGLPLDIHPSRLVIFHGIAPLGDIKSKTTADGWGRSVLPGMLDALRRVDELATNVNSLTYEAKVDVVKIPDLMSNLQKRGTAYEQEVLRRLTLAATAKGINGTLMLDALEEYASKSASFGGLPDILDRFMQLASAAVGIPMTLYFMISPGGLNATGASDTRAYYDKVKVEQTLRMQPAMSVLDECVIWSALNERPADLHYTWRSLWQPTAKERADTGKVAAETMKIAAEMGAVSEEAAGKALVNALTESGAFPGLEGYAEEFPFESDDSLDTVERGLLPDGQEGDTSQVADAAPRTLYVRRDVLNADEIIAWAKGQGFKTTLPADDMHVTVMFSRTPVDWMKMGETWRENPEIAPGGARLMEQFGEARVLLFNSSELSWRHEEMKRQGATWDHPEYQPHITISYDPDAPDLADIEPYKGRILLGPEIFEAINEKWHEGVTEQ